VLTAISFLHGLAVEELHQEELDSWEPGYEVLITLGPLRQECLNDRRTSGNLRRGMGLRPASRARMVLILLYHRVC
jgi:hypothetical protein